MTLIRSISGIRGTIGGKPGEGLSPLDIVKYTAAYAYFIAKQAGKERLQIVIGRDARISGEMVSMNVASTLMAMGADVTDCGLSTTPSVEMAVTRLGADGGIIITASHNPKQWNALKLLNGKGEFLSAADAAEVLAIAERKAYAFVDVKSLGAYSRVDDSISKHIEAILALPVVDVEAIKDAGFKVCVDAVNSTGGMAVPELLEALGVKKIEKLFCEPSGRFAHNPEPLPEHLSELSQVVVKTKSHLGFAVDPDVDRLAIVDESGDMFGEEYTLVAVADHILKSKPGNTVSNLSSTSALRDVTEKFKGCYFPSAVGEVNVVEMMKAKNAVIGGEGNGGVIYPELHYGRDALLAIAIFLTALANSKMSCSSLRSTLPDYYISKNKIEVDATTDLDSILEQIRTKYSKHPQINIDGVRIDFEKEWVHLRRSNTESVIRIYAESDSMPKAEHLAQKIIQDTREFLR
jgi:phosphomannomutase